MSRETAEFASDLHAGLSTLQVPEFDQLHIIGMAATLAIHIKGALPNKGGAAAWWIESADGQDKPARGVWRSDIGTAVERRVKLDCATTRYRSESKKVRTQSKSSPPLDYVEALSRF